MKKPMGSPTGRLAQSQPAIQNIRPRLTEEQREIVRAVREAILREKTDG